MKTIIEQKSAIVGHPSIKELKQEHGTIPTVDTRELFGSSLDQPVPQECIDHNQLTPSQMSRLVQRDTIQGTLEDFERGQRDLDKEMRTSWETRLTLQAIGKH